MQTEAFPRRYEFRRASRIWQFLRAFIVLAVGLALVVYRLRLTENPTVLTLLLYLGGFIAVSGVIAILTLVVLTLNDKKQVVEVDETGFTLHRGDKPEPRAFKWMDVRTYEKDTGGPLLDLTSWMDSATNPQSGGGDLLGCAFSLVLWLYVLLLQLFVGGITWKVKFNLKNKKGFSFTGPGKGMDILVDQVLPHYLPGKLKQPKPAAPPDTEKPAEETGE